MLKTDVGWRRNCNEAWNGAAVVVVREGRGEGLKTHCPAA
jgi:hypothetical protein